MDNETSKFWLEKLLPGAVLVLLGFGLNTVVDITMEKDTRLMYDVSESAPANFGGVWTQILSVRVWNDGDLVIEDLSVDILKPAGSISRSDIQSATALDETYSGKERESLDIPVLNPDDSFTLTVLWEHFREGHRASFSIRGRGVKGEKPGTTGTATWKAVLPFLLGGAIALAFTTLYERQTNARLRQVVQQLLLATGGILPPISKMRY